MDELAQPFPCVGCGLLTPRSEMFGAAPDLRCPTCADLLRTRVHPSHVRRAPSTFRPASARPDLRTTASLLGLMGVLWLAVQLDALAPHWLRVLFEVPFDVNLAARAVVAHPYPWQPALWALQHVQLWHLVMNGLSLFQLGRWFEWGWGGRGLLFVVLGSGMAGTASGWLVNGVPTIGLSGGIFGLEAWLIALRRHHVLAGALVNRVFIHSLLAGNVLMIVLTEMGGWQISHVGHAAGFLWGLFAGFAARSRAPRLGLLAMLLLTATLLVLPSFVAPLGWPVRIFGGGT